MLDIPGDAALTNRALAVLQSGSRAAIPRHVWTTDRWARFLIGVSLVLCLTIGWSTGELAGLNLLTALLLAAGTHLVITAMVGWCPIHEAMRYLGVKDREEVFASELRAAVYGVPEPRGGGVGWRPRVLESNAIHVAEEAAEYDAMAHRHAKLLNRPFVDLIDRLGAQPRRVLDVGTGPGWVPVELALRMPRCEFWALDASPDMLARAQQHAAAAGVGERIHFVQGDALQLPFPAGHFDLVISNFTLHHLEQPQDFLNEAARVACQGGRVVVKDLRRQPRWKAALLLAFSKHMLGYSPVQLQLYRESMDAALTMDEARTAVARSRLIGASVRGFRGLDFVISADVGSGTPSA